MAKKHRERVWYTALFQKDADIAFLNRQLKEGTVFFDKEPVAYSYAVNQRLTPLRDENNEIIVNEEGYAQLPDLGKITVIGIKGHILNWKKVEKAPKDALRNIGINADSICVNHPISLNKQTLSVVLEESDEAYERFEKSPMVLKSRKSSELKQTAHKVVEELKKDGIITTENNFSTVES